MRSSSASPSLLAPLIAVFFVLVAPASPAANANWRFYVTNETSGNLTVIDGASRKAVATIPLGKRPRGIQPSPGNRYLYIAMSGSPIAPPGTHESKLPPPDRTADGIGVFDIETHQVIRTLRGVSDPEQLAVSADGKQIYVASEDAGKAIVLDANSGRQLAALDVGGEPEGTARSPDGRYIYMSSEADHRVSVIDTRTHKIAAQIAVGLRPRAIAFAHSVDRAYVSGEADGTITIIDTQRFVPLQTFHFDNKAARPMGLVAAPDDRYLFVTTGRGGTVARIDLKRMQLDGEVQVGTRPWGLAMSPDGQVLATANGPSNDVTLIDARRFTIIGKVPAGQGPWGVVAMKTP
jgi:YVTN family beta-propeller protein